MQRMGPLDMASSVRTSHIDIRKKVHHIAQTLFKDMRPSGEPVPLSLPSLPFSFFCTSSFRLLSLNLSSPQSPNMTQNIAGHIVKRKKAIPFPTSSAPAYKTLSNVYEEVYNTPEIRQTILSFLPRTELIKIVTLEKKIVADVAKELYHTVTYRQVKKMRRTTVSRVPSEKR